MTATTAPSPAHPAPTLGVTARTLEAPTRKAPMHPAPNTQGTQPRTQDTAPRHPAVAPSVRTQPALSPTPTATPRALDDQTPAPAGTHTQDAPSYSAPAVPWWVVIGGILLCTVLAAALNAQTLVSWAELCGFGPINLPVDRTTETGPEPARFWLSWFYPVILDVYGVLATVIVLIGFPTFSKSTVRWAAANIALSIAISVTFAALEHYISARITQGTWDMADAPLVLFAGGATPAFLVGAGVHLGALALRDRYTVAIRIHDLRTQVLEATRTQDTGTQPSTLVAHAETAIAATAPRTRTQPKAAPTVASAPRVSKPSTPSPTTAPNTKPVADIQVVIDAYTQLVREGKPAGRDHVHTQVRRTHQCSDKQFKTELWPAFRAQQTNP